ncbi:hypothetical protein BGZ60DRAFT_549610 [Tricladium varicosporioides]|nr:hypothetical protein BGZ60DRAFT_549610 [Hymenoscyphus varicosporioides]
MDASPKRHACKGEPYGGPRIHRIAPDPVNCSRTVFGSAHVQFGIIHRHPYPVPSLLHACRDLWNAAIEVHALWPCANPDTCAKDERSIYVNKAYDIFFFADMACGGPHEFWFLHTIVNKSTRESMNADDNARARFLHNINGIQLIALNWEMWLRCLGSYPKPAPWLQNLPQLKALTVILLHVHSLSSEEVIPTFWNITPGMVWARCADHILRLMEGDLDATYMSYWRIRVPRLNALAAVGFHDDDENFEDDLWYLKHLEFDSQTMHSRHYPQ